MSGQSQYCGAATASRYDQAAGIACARPQPRHYRSAEPKNALRVRAISHSPDKEERLAVIAFRSLRRDLDGILGDLPWQAGMTQRELSLLRVTGNKYFTK
jgi:hypothetical protein